MLNLGAVDDRDGAAADDVQLLVSLQNDRRVFVDAYADQERIHRDRGEQATDAMTLSKVLIDDQLARQSESWGEHHEFSTRRVAFAALRDHVIANDARACRRSRHDRSIAMRAADRAGEFGASEHRDDASLIATREKNARDLLDEREFVRVFSVSSRRDAHDVHFCAEFAKDRLVRVGHLDGDARCRRKHGDFGVFWSARVFDDVAQNCTGADLVFSSADRDERSALRMGMRGMTFCGCFVVRAGFGLGVRHVGRTDTTVR